MAEIKGLDKFKAKFAGLEAQYILIGGVACNVVLGEAGLSFRATKDLDIVLCIEALDDAFIERFWAFVRIGDYELQEKSQGEHRLYRFQKPKSEGDPAMLELFSRRLDNMEIGDTSQLTPIPADGELSSLSAILLDDDYYACIERGRTVVDGLPVLKAEYLILFKAKAWLDLTGRKANDEKVDSKHITKHRNDVFRLFPLVTENLVVETSDAIQADVSAFLDAMQNEQNLDPKNFGVRRALPEVITMLRKIYLNPTGVED